MRRFKSRYVDLAVKALLQLFWICGLQKKFHRFF